MVIYINLDNNNYLTGWSSTRSSDSDTSIWLPTDHDFFKSDMHAWQYLDNELVFDEDKQQQLVDEREKEENKNSRLKDNELATIELANMVAITQQPQPKTMSLMSGSGGDNMIALLFATNIIEGYITFDDVGHLWVDEVKQILKSEGREDLIK